jgi:hypothetical protein
VINAVEWGLHHDFPVFDYFFERGAGEIPYSEEYLELFEKIFKKKSTGNDLRDMADIKDSKSKSEKTISQLLTQYFFALLCHFQEQKNDKEKLKSLVRLSDASNALEEHEISGFLSKEGLREYRMLSQALKDFKEKSVLKLDFSTIDDQALFQFIRSNESLPPFVLNGLKKETENREDLKLAKMILKKRWDALKPKTATEKALDFCEEVALFGLENDSPETEKLLALEMERTQESEALAHQEQRALREHQVGFSSFDEFIKKIAEGKSKALFEEFHHAIIFGEMEKLEAIFCADLAIFYHWTKDSLSLIKEEERNEFNENTIILAKKYIAEKDHLKKSKKAKKRQQNLERDWREEVRKIEPRIKHKVELSEVNQHRLKDFCAQPDDAIEFRNLKQIVEVLGGTVEEANNKIHVAFHLIPSLNHTSIATKEEFATSQNPSKHRHCWGTHKKHMNQVQCDPAFYDEGKKKLAEIFNF